MKRPANPFGYSNSLPEVIRLVVMRYIRFPLSLRNVEDLPFERGIGICHETVQHGWNGSWGQRSRTLTIHSDHPVGTGQCLWVEADDTTKWFTSFWTNLSSGITFVRTI